MQARTQRESQCLSPAPCTLVWFYLQRVLCRCIMVRRVGTGFLPSDGNSWACADTVYFPSPPCAPQPNPSLSFYCNIRFPTYLCPYFRSRLFPSSAAPFALPSAVSGPENIGLIFVQFPEGPFVRWLNAICCNLVPPFRRRSSSEPLLHGAV